MPSIRNKIRVSFYLFAATIVALTATSYTDLRYLQERIEMGIGIYDFQDAIEHSRRYEKNLFLYQQPGEQEQALLAIQQAEDILSRQQHTFVSLMDLSAIVRLEQTLNEYKQRLHDYDLSVFQPAQQQQIRTLGQQLVETGQNLRLAERQSLDNAVSRSQWWLLLASALITVLGIGAAHLISRAVVKPMRQLGTQLSHIVGNRFSPLIPSSDDQEIVSMCAAMNHMQSELEEQNHQLIQSEKLASLGTLVSGVAHELNNPLSNISSSCQILIEDIQRGRSTEPMEWLQQIDDETQRAQRIVSTLLSFSREQNFVKQTSQLHSLVSDAVLLIGNELHAQIQLDIPDDLILEVDGQRLQQVLVNLIGNAMDAGGEQLEIHIRARQLACDEFSSPEPVVYGRRRCPLKGSQMVLIEVEDNGSGIAADILPRIFDPFFTTKEVGHGSGLGLYVSEEIIDMHNGCIGVRSKPGQGSHFYIGLPAEGVCADVQ